MRGNLAQASLPAPGGPLAVCGAPWLGEGSPWPLHSPSRGVSLRLGLTSPAFVLLEHLSLDLGFILKARGSPAEVYNATTLAKALLPVD